MPAIDFPPYAAAILFRLHSLGYAAYCVGGCVRDSLLGRTAADWDIATSALPSETEAAFAALPTYRVRTGNGLRHGTVTVYHANDPHACCEITTFRTEGTYTDHRRPDAVTFVSRIEDDLARRDFTVNAMAAAPAPDGAVELIDPFGGQNDLAARTIRAVGAAEHRFTEDALRILRGLRFAARYGFTVEAKTADAMHTLAPTLSLIAPERIGAELLGFFSGAHCGAVAAEFADIFQLLLPGVCAENAHALDTLPSPDLRFAVFCQNADPDDVRRAVLHYALGGHTAEKIARLTAYAQHSLCDHAALCRLADVFGSSGITEYFAYRRAISPHDSVIATAEQKIRTIFQSGACYNTATLAVNGKMLRSAGIAPGRALGTLLATLTEEVIAQKLPNDPAALIARALELADQ